MALPYDPNFTYAVKVGQTRIENDLEHDSSASAAVVAVHLLSSARLALDLDTEYTEYSAQYLVDNASSHGLNLTVKDCLELALKEGIPKAANWTHLGSVLKPPSSFKPALVSIKGDVIETKNMEEVGELVKLQPVGAKLHVFRPHIDLVGDGIYGGPSGEDARYVGLRDVIIVGMEKIQGKAYATVKIWYKRKFTYVKVALGRMFMNTSVGITKPTGLLTDFVVPRLTID